MLSPVNPNKTAYFAIATPNTVAYLLAKLPVGLIELYAVSLWIGGLVNLSYPPWWGAFRNPPPGAPLSPAPAFSPFGWFREGAFPVATLPPTFTPAPAGAPTPPAPPPTAPARP